MRVDPRLTLPPAQRDDPKAVLAQLGISLLPSRQPGDVDGLVRALYDLLIHIAQQEPPQEQKKASQ
jgi:hypothetical protein